MTSGADAGDTDALSGRMRSARAQWALVALGLPRLHGLCQPARVLPEADLTTCPERLELPGTIHTTVPRTAPSSLQGDARPGDVGDARCMGRTARTPPSPEPSTWAGRGWPVLAGTVLATGAIG